MKEVWDEDVKIYRKLTIGHWLQKIEKEGKLEKKAKMEYFEQKMKWKDYRLKITLKKEDMQWKKNIQPWRFTGKRKRKFSDLVKVKKEHVKKEDTI